MSGIRMAQGGVKGLLAPEFQDWKIVKVDVKNLHLAYVFFEYLDLDDVVVWAVGSFWMPFFG